MKEHLKLRKGKQPNENVKYFGQIIQKKNKQQISI